MQAQAVGASVERLDTVAQQARHKADTATAKQLLDLDVHDQHAIHAFLQRMLPVPASTTASEWTCLADMGTG